MISTLTSEMEKATTKRNEEHMVFLKVEAELDLGVKELEGAAAEIKHGTGGASFAQGARKLQQASEKAQALGFLKKERHEALLSALLEDGEHATNSGDIVEVIEDVERDFKKELEDLREKESTAERDYKDLMHTKTNSKTDAEGDLAKDQEDETEKTSKIGVAGTDLTKTNAQLMDDKAYLLELTARCNAKSKMWDQRSAMRTDEITAITTALTIVKGKVSEKTTEKTVRLVQLPQPSAPADALADEDSD